MRHFQFIAAAFLAVAPLAAAWSAPIPVEDLAAFPVVRDPHLSPDGRRIAARATIDGAAKLIVIDADRPAAPPKTIALGKAVVSDLHWAGNDRLLLTIVKRAEVYGIVMPMGRLVIVDLKTSQVRMADQKSRGLYGGDVLYADPGGAWAVVASQDDPFVNPSVKRVDLATGVAQVIEKARPDVWDWYVDNNGLVRAGLAYNNRRWTLWYREKPGEPLKAIKGRISKADDSSVDRFTFGRAGTGMIITNERTGRFAVYNYDFATGTIGTPVYEHPTVDISDIWADGLTGEITGIEYEDDRTRYVWLDPKLKQVQARLDRALPHAENNIVGRSLDDSRFLVWSGGASDPGSYFLLDNKTARMSPVVTPFQRIDPAALSPVKAVRYTARDGLELPAYLTLPKDRAPRQLPLILMPHGGPFARDSWDYDPFVQFFASRGYAVLQPQFRGSTGYGKDFVTRGYGEWGRKMQDDLDDGVDWLVRSGQVDPKRVCIVGASYGGYAALWGAIRNPERYRCAASVAGVTDLTAQLRDNRKSFSATRYFREWRTKVAGENVKDLRTISPLYQASLLKVPVLIAHGEQDETVSVKQGHAMVKALEKTGANVTSVFYKEAGHDFDRSEDLRDFLQRLEAFMAKHNPA